MDVSDFTKPGSMYLKAANVTDAEKPIFVIIGEPMLVDKEFEGKKSQALCVEGQLEETPYKFDLSKTIARTVAADLGTDTKEWNSCQLVLETYKTKNSKGVLVDAINIKEVKKIA